MESNLKEAKQRENSLIEHFHSIMRARGLTAFKRADGIGISALTTPCYYVSGKPTFLSVAKEIGWKGLVKEDIAWGTLQTNMKMLKEQVDMGGSEEAKKYDLLMQHMKCVEKKEIRIRGLK